MAPRRTPRALAAGLLLIALACDRADSSFSVSSSNDTSERLAVQVASPLVAKMLSAPDHVRFRGTRRHEVRWNLPFGQRQLVYRENVFSDGAGGFAIDPVALLEPTVSWLERDVFLLMQKAREGFLYRYRDFRVHDAGLFLANYVIVDPGTAVSVAGRNCAELWIERRDGASRRFRVAVDLETGIALSVREESLQGILLTSMEYERFSLAPDLSQVELHDPQVQEEPLDESASPTLGFAPAEPRLLPSGYRRLEATRVYDAEERGWWAKYTYSDGLELVFFLHGGERGGETAGVDADVIQASSVGPWRVLRGSLRGQRVLAMGKAPEPELLRMIDSAFFR